MNKKVKKKKKFEKPGNGEAHARDGNESTMGKWKRQSVNLSI